MTYQLRHTDDGAQLCRLTAAGWEIMQNSAGNGQADSRGTGGWWLYQGDEQEARAEQAERWDHIRQRMNDYYAQAWV